MLNCCLYVYMCVDQLQLLLVGGGIQIGRVDVNKADRTISGRSYANLVLNAQTVPIPGS